EGDILPPLYVTRIFKIRMAAVLGLAAILSLGWLLLGFVSSNHSSKPGSPLALTSCTLPGVAGPARCGTFEVFEDRAAHSERNINLLLAPLPAPGPPPPVPVFFSHGGPGPAPTGLVPLAGSGPLGGLKKNHDMIFVDQRGTGSSNPLQCDGGDDPADLQVFF